MSLLLAASLSPADAGPGGTAAAAIEAARIQREAQQPSEALTEEQLNDYTQQLARSPDANAWGLDRDGDLRRIFAPYFACYRAKLDGERRQILRNAKEATIIFGKAFEACSALRTEATAKAIESASRDPDLSPRERELAVEYYRQWQGQLMLKDYFSQKGLAQRFSIISAQMSANQQRNK